MWRRRAKMGRPHPRLTPGIPPSYSKVSTGELGPELGWGHLKEGTCFVIKGDFPSGQWRFFLLSVWGSRITGPQRCLCPNLQNLWLWDLTWQKAFADLDK